MKPCGAEFGNMWVVWSFLSCNYDTVYYKSRHWLLHYLLLQTVISNQTLGWRCECMYVGLHEGFLVGGRTLWRPKTSPPEPLALNFWQHWLCCVVQVIVTTKWLDFLRVFIFTANYPLNQPQSVYCIAGKLLREETLRLQEFVAICKSFLSEIWGCGVCWRHNWRHQQAICESFLQENLIFHAMQYKIINFPGGMSPSLMIFMSHIFL